MARIPTIKAQVSPRVASDPGVQIPQPQTPGAELGQGLAEVADRMAQVEQRKDTARNVVQRTKAIGLYKDQAAAELRRLKLEDDITSEETLGAYREFLSKRQGEFVQQYGGGDEMSQLQLHALLEDSRGGYLSAAQAESFAAADKLVETTLQGEIANLAGLVQQDPGSLDAVVEEADILIGQAAAALPPDRERAFRNNARTQFVTGAFDTLMLNGATDEAEGLLTNPDIAEALPQQTRFQMRSKLISARAERSRLDQEAQNALRRAELIVGRNLTAGERMKLAGLQPDPGRVTALQKVQEAEAAMGRTLTEQERRAILGISTGKETPTFAEKVADIETGIGRPLTDEEKTKLAGASVPGEDKGVLDAAEDIETLLGRDLTDAEKREVAGFGQAGGLPEQIAMLESALGRSLNEEEIKRLGKIDSESDFGRSLTGRATTTMENLAVNFGAGLLEPEEERRFQSAITLYMQERQITDPDTGQVVRIRPTLPPYAQEALEARGMTFDAERGLVPIDEPPPGAQAGPEQPGQTAPAAPAAAAPSAGAPSPAAPQPASPQPPTPDAPQYEMPEDSTQTVFEMTGLLAGPGPAIGRTLSSTPGLGDVARAPQMNAAAQYVTGLQQQLVNALRQNPRFTEGERQAISEDISILGKPFDTQGAFIDRLRGVDQALQARLQEAATILAQGDEATTKEIRQSAMQTIALLAPFRERLGVPPTVKSPEAAKKLPPDIEYFFNPAGVMFRNPNFGQGATDGE